MEHYWNQFHEILGCSAVRGRVYEIYQRTIAYLWVSSAALLGARFILLITYLFIILLPGNFSNVPSSWQRLIIYCNKKYYK